MVPHYETQLAPRIRTRIHRKARLQVCPDTCGSFGEDGVEALHPVPTAMCILMLGKKRRSHLLVKQIMVKQIFMYRGIRSSGEVSVDAQPDLLERIETVPLCSECFPHTLAPSPTNTYPYIPLFVRFLII